MKCPTCEGEMIEGMSELQSRGLSWLFFGISHLHLFFYPAVPRFKKKTLVLASTKKAKSYLCNSCKTLVIPNEKRQRSKGFDKL